MIRVFINGFGRIGRHVMRIILEDERFEVVGINDLGDFSQMAMLLQYDSIYHKVDLENLFVKEEKLWIKDQTIPLFCESSPKNLPLKALGVDLVLGCCGAFLTQEACKPFLEAGAKKVLISTPPKDEMPTFLYGVNHQKYQDEPMVSNSSCSANAIVPIFTIMESLCGRIESAMLSMYHSYTSYQRLVDSKHYAKDIRRCRSATQNIIPLESSASQATSRFFPHLEGKLYAKSIRVPVSAVTLYDLTIKLTHKCDAKTLALEIPPLLKKHWRGIVAWQEQRKVSTDYIQDPHSAVIDASQLNLCEGDLLRIAAWQDNEYGYARRLVDMAAVVGS